MTKKWDSPVELASFAVEEIKKAIANNCAELKIQLEEAASGDMDTVRKKAEKYGIKDTTEYLRRVYSDYNIKSRVGCEGYLKGIISFEGGPCNMFRPLIWTLYISKKEI